MHGMYVYYKDGERLDIRESFTFHAPNASNAQRAGFGHNLTVNMLEHRNQSVVGAGLLNDQLQVTAQYHFAKSLKVSHSVGSQRTHQEIDLPPNSIFFPLMRCYTGKVIRQIVAQGGKATVIVPDIRDPYNKETVLLPLFEERTAQKLSQATLTLGDQTYHTEVFSYIGGAYDDAARFWLVDDMLVRYVFQDWDVQLVNSELKGQKA